MGAYLKFRLKVWALNLKGAFIISFPVGNQAYLSSIIQFALRVFNKVPIETSFSCIPTIKM